MEDRTRGRARRALSKVAPSGAAAKVPATKRELEELRRRVQELEATVQELEVGLRESRRLNRRLAELTDVVQELLVPLSQRDEEKVSEYLERYAASL